MSSVSDSSTKRSSIAVRTFSRAGEPLGRARDLGRVGRLAQGAQLTAAYDRGAHRMLIAWAVDSAILARAVDPGGWPLGARPFVLVGNLDAGPPTFAFPRLQPAGAHLVLDWRPEAALLRVASVSAARRTRVEGTLVARDQARGSRQIGVATATATSSALVVWGAVEDAPVNTELRGRVVVPVS